MKTKILPVLAFGLTVLAGSLPARAASILWVSDNQPAGFSGPGSGLGDQGFLTLLQNAGHSVDRYNPPDSGAIPSADVDQINTYDLVIVGRAINSSAVDTDAEAGPWNTLITRPCLYQSAYLMRASRLGWFTGSTVANGTPTPLTAGDLNDPVTAYIFGAVAMNGNTTVDLYDEAVDQNTSQITDSLVPGGRVLASATLNPSPAVIAEWPAGTAVRAGALAGYRMYFGSGSRELSGAPVSEWGKENLTATGEALFLAAVDIALNDGQVAGSNPVGFTVQPASQMILQSEPVTFSTIVTGSPPRTLQWQRSDDGGTVFNDIPGANDSAYTIDVTTPADDGAIFRLFASNQINSLYSQTATLTIIPDTLPPEIVSVASLEGLAIGVCFDGRLDTNAVFGLPVAIDPFAYAVNGGSSAITNVVWGPNDSAVVIYVAEPGSSGFVVTAFPGLADRAGNTTTDLLVAQGQVLGWAAQDIGTPGAGPLEPGSTFVCNLDQLRVVAGGTDIWGTGDEMHSVYTAIEGFFDIRVRVESLLFRREFTKAGVMARASTDAGSANVALFVTPTFGKDFFTFQWRDTEGAPTSSRHRENSPDAPTNSPAYPNAWVRLVRAGPVFNAYFSDNGTDWVLFGVRTNVSLPERMLVGLATTSHNNNAGEATVALYRDLELATPPGPLNLVHADGVFSFEFRSDAGFSYVVEYKNSLQDAAWTPLETRPGDGTMQAITDQVGDTPTRFYQIRIP